jgi:hypothetical protein
MKMKRKKRKFQSYICYRKCRPERPEKPTQYRYWQNEKLTMQKNYRSDPKYARYGISKNKRIR